VANVVHTAPRVAPGGGALKVFMGAGRFVRLMARNKAGFAGFLGVVFFLIVSFIVPIFLPISTDTVVGDILQPATWAHPLGTDLEGRDVLTQVIHGGADVLVIGFLTAALTTAIAVALGSLTAFIGGWFDEIVMGVTDIVLSIPQFPLLAVLAAFISLGNIYVVSLVLALLGWPFLTRAVRSQVLSLKERDYVEAARSLDLGTPHILFREILPNMMSYVAISFTLAATGAVYAEVGLIFLGLVPLTGTSWGLMMNQAVKYGEVYNQQAILNILGPVAAVALFQLSLVFMTRSLETVFNPRLAREG